MRFSESHPGKHFVADIDSTHLTKALHGTYKIHYNLQQTCAKFRPALDTHVSGSPVAVPGVRLAVGAAALHTDRGIFIENMLGAAA